MLSMLDKMFPNFWNSFIIIINHWSSYPDADTVRHLQNQNYDELQKLLFNLWLFEHCKHFFFLRGLTIYK